MTGSSNSQPWTAHGSATEQLARCCSSMDAGGWERHSSCSVTAGVDGDEQEKPHCYFLAEQSTATTQRLRLARQLIAALPSDGAAAEDIAVSWNALLRYASQHTKERKKAAGRFAPAQTPRRNPLGNQPLSANEPARRSRRHRLTIMLWPCGLLPLLRLL